MTDFLTDIDRILTDLEKSYSERNGTLPVKKRVCTCDYKDYANGNHDKKCPERKALEAARPKRWRYG